MEPGASNFHSQIEGAQNDHIDEVVIEEQKEGETSTGNTRFCPACKVPIVEGGVYCTGCGRRLEDMSLCYCGAFAEYTCGQGRAFENEICRRKFCKTHVCLDAQHSVYVCLGCTARLAALARAVDEAPPVVQHKRSSVFVCVMFFIVLFFLISILSGNSSSEDE